MSPKLYPNLYEKLKDKAIITTNDALSVTEDKYQTAQELTRLNQGGYLKKIRRGLYALVPIEFVGKDYQPDKFLVASRVSEPYAISYYSALELHGIGQSVFNRVYISSPHRFVSFAHQGIEYKWRFTKDLFGATTLIREGQVINVTDIERTILDCLRQPDLAGGVDELIRSLEGLRGTDLLAVIYKHTINQNEAPTVNKFRADWETRIPDINHLVNSGIIKPGRNGYELSLVGLFYCPLPEAQQDIKVAEKIYQYLRVKYKENPEQQHSYIVIANDLSEDPQRIKRILPLILSAGPIYNSSDGQGTQVTLAETILNYKEFNDLLQYVLSNVGKNIVSPAEGAFIDIQRLIEYLARFNEKALYAKTGFLLRLFETNWKVEPEVFDNIKKHISRAKYYWPPKLARGTGEQIKEWNLIVPEYLVNKYQYATRQKVS
ncbi:MAG: hypothetical protein HZA49_03620 [Planctomycetes bacterium]|nr:hypothetical protein [Planctomycetota bacterium]